MKRANVIFLALYGLLYSQLISWSHAKSPITPDVFFKMPMKQKLQLLETVRANTVFREYLNKVSIQKIDQTSFVKWQLLLQFIDISAYAANEKNQACIYAGWPSQMQGQYCVHPNKLSAANKSQFDRLKKGSCQRDNTTLQLLCNPLLFGKGSNQEGICVDSGIRYRKDQDPIYRSRNTSLMCWQQAQNAAQDIANYDEAIIEEIIKSKENTEEFLKIVDMIFDACLCAGEQEKINKEYAQKIMHHRTCSALVAQLEEIFNQIDYMDKNHCLDVQNENTQRFKEILEIKKRVQSNIVQNMKDRLDDKTMQDFADIILNDSQLLSAKDEKALIALEKEYGNKAKGLEYSCGHSPEISTIAIQPSAISTTRPSGEPIPGAISGTGTVVPSETEAETETETEAETEAETETETETEAETEAEAEAETSNCTLTFADIQYENNQYALVTAIVSGENCASTERTGDFSWEADEKEVPKTNTDSDSEFQPTITADEPDDSSEENQDSGNGLIQSTRKITLDNDRPIKVKVDYTFDEESISGETTVQGQYVPNNLTPMQIYQPRKRLPRFDRNVR